MNATCPDCIASEQRLHHGFMAECMGCKARAASRSQYFKRCQDAGRLDRDYLALLAAHNLTHDDVKVAFDGDAMNKARTQ